MEFNSQLGQDVFIANYFNFLRGGQYLEIGAGHPQKGNNTYALEKELNWKGLSVENNPEVRGYWGNFRKQPLVCEDAFELDFGYLLGEYKFDKTIHYLSLDLDENIRTCYDCLIGLPFESYDFLALSVEHDYYDNQNVDTRNAIRYFLHDNNYELVFADVSLEGHGSIEDWWIRKDIYEENPIEPLAGQLFHQGLKTWKYAY